MDINKFKNKFIVFEGWENTGKTSVAHLLVDYLNKNNIETVFTFQPGGDWGPISTTIRSLCKDKRWNLSEEANLHAFLLDRAECMHKIIRPSIQAGKTVVCDRHSYSTVAYQLFGKKLIDHFMTHVGKEATFHIINWLREPYNDIMPNIVYYFPNKVGNRINDENDLFDNEKEEFEKRVKQAYNEMSGAIRTDGKDHGWKIVKPGSSAEETLTNLLAL